MKIERLDWDSAFFACEVFRLSITYADNPEDIAAVVSGCAFDVVYIWCPEESRLKYGGALDGLGAKQVDCRVTYLKAVDNVQAPADVIQVHAATPALRELAYISGCLSRFNTDPGLKKDFTRLYDCWIDQALKDNKGIVCGILDENGILAGMGTASVKGRMGKIGLIATSPKSQGKGIGKRLLKFCEAFYYRKGATECNVVTQEANKQACRFYEFHGYRVSNKTDVWHLWKNDV